MSEYSVYLKDGKSPQVRLGSVKDTNMGASKELLAKSIRNIVAPAMERVGRHIDNKIPDMEHEWRLPSAIGSLPDIIRHHIVKTVVRDEPGAWHGHKEYKTIVDQPCFGSVENDHGIFYWLVASCGDGQEDWISSVSFKVELRIKETKKEKKMMYCVERPSCVIGMPRSSWDDIRLPQYTGKDILFTHLHSTLKIKGAPLGISDSIENALRLMDFMKAIWSSENGIASSLVGDGKHEKSKFSLYTSAPFKAPTFDK